MLLQPNTLLRNRYLIVRQIGQGGMGAVYEAKDKNLGHTVALKQMIVSGTSLQQAFEREARILARLRHPALPNVTDYFVESNGQFLVMEYIPGDDLDSLLRQQGRPFSLSQVVEWADQLLDVLEYLHGHQPPIIHRDIKPSNIKLAPFKSGHSGAGQVILLDFGLSKGGMTDNTRLTMSGASIYGFTPHYASLEQINGSGTDPRSDLYSLGTTLYHLFTAITLPTATTRAQAQITRKPDPLRPANELNPQVPPHIVDLLVSTTALDPDQRPASATAMRAMLKAPAPAPSTVVVPSPVEPKTYQKAKSPPTKSYQPSPPATKSPSTSPRWIPLAIGFVLALAIVFAAITLRGNSNERTVSAPTEPPANTPIVSTTRSEVVVSDNRPTATATLRPTETVTEDPQPTVALTSAELSLPVLQGTLVPEPIMAISPDNAEEVIELARWGKGIFRKIAISQDGELLVVGSSIGIYLYDTKTLDEVRFIETSNEVNSITFNPTEDMLAVGFFNGTVELRRLDGALIHTLEEPSGVTLSVLAFSPDGKTLASSSSDSTVRLWRVEDGQLLSNLEGHTDTVSNVAFNPNGDILVSASSNGTIQLWRTKDGEPLFILEGHTDRVPGLAFSDDGKILVSGSWDKTVRLWQTSDGKLIDTLEEHTDKVWNIAFSGSIFASASDDGTVRLWKASDRKLINTLQIPFARNILLSSDGKILITLSFDGIQLWQTDDGKLLSTLDNTDLGDQVAFSPDRKILALTVNGQVSLWRVENGDFISSFEGYTSGISSIAFSPEGNILASGSADTTVRLWRVEDRQQLSILEGHTSQIESIAFSPDGTLLVSGDIDGNIHLWQVSDGQLLNTLEGHTDWVHSVVFSPDGQSVASGSSDKTVRLWRVEDGKSLFTLDSDSVRDVAFSPNGKTLVSGGDKISLWNVEDGTLIGILEEQTDETVYSLAFSEDGSTLASGSQRFNNYDNYTVRLWQVEDRKLIHILKGHTDVIESVEFSPDGKILASASYDGTVRLWGVPPSR